MEKSNNNEVNDTLDKVLQSENDIIYKGMTRAEFEFIRNRVGLSLADIGNAAMYVEARNGYHRSTVSRWINEKAYYEQFVIIKAVKLLSYYLTKEEFIALRIEWIRLTEELEKKRLERNK